MTGNFSLQIKLINKCYIINYRLKLVIVEKNMGVGWGGGSKKNCKQSFVGQITERRTEILNQESYDNSGLTLF